MPLIFRIVKGEPLTFLEGDNNLRYLEGLTISSSAAFSNWTGSASSQFAGTASLALTASYALNAGTTIDTGSLVSTASFNAFTSSYNTGSFSGSFTGELTGTASFAISASWAPPTIIDTGSLLLTSSFNDFTSSYFQDSSSFDQRINGISFDTGSLLTTESFNSFTASYNTGSFTGSFSGSLYGTSSWAESSSFAITASHALNIPVIDLSIYTTTSSFDNFTSSYYNDSSSFDQRINSISFDSSSLVTTESFNNFTASYNTGSFTGSFTGELIGTASWAVSASWAPSSLLSTTFISTGSVTASVNTTGNIFTVASSSVNLMAVSSSGIVTIATSGSASTMRLYMAGGLYPTIETLSNSEIVLKTNNQDRLKIGDNVTTNVPIVLATGGGGLTPSIIRSGAGNRISDMLLQAGVSGSVRGDILIQSGSLIAQGGEFRVTTGSTDYLRVFPSTGNVFIGSTPTDGGTKLEVNGTAKIQTALTINRSGQATIVFQNNNITYAQFRGNSSDQLSVTDPTGGTIWWGFQQPVNTTGSGDGFVTQRIGKWNVRGGIINNTQFPAIYAENTNSANQNSNNEVLRLQSIITGNEMADGFGGNITFYNSDIASVNNHVATLGWRRMGGADNSGGITFATANAGTITEAARITHLGNLLIGAVTESGDRLFVSGSGRFTNGLTVTGSFTVVTGSSRELQVRNTGVDIGSIVTDIHTVTGSLNITGSATITDVLTLPFQDPLPSGKPTGSIALSGSGATYSGMFVYDGANWVTA